jgi:mono/diheme cytochrome c family protein
MTRKNLLQMAVLVTGVLMLLAPAIAGAAETATPNGDPSRGKALFVGTTSFAKGGAPCLACHGIAGAGLGRAAGANYGPDLTPTYESYGDEGVAAILEELAFPSMEPIFASRPLTEQERVDVAAFLAKVGEGAAPRIGGVLAVQVVLVVAVFLGLIGVLGWRRLQGVRQPLVELTQTRKG